MTEEHLAEGFQQPHETQANRIVNQSTRDSFVPTFPNSVAVPVLFNNVRVVLDNWCKTVPQTFHT